MSTIYLTIEELRTQCSVDPDLTNHDAQLTRLAKAAADWFTEFTERSVSEFVLDSPQDSPESGLKEDVKSALLLHVEAHFDKNVDNFEMLLKAANNLAWPYRIGLGVDGGRDCRRDRFCNSPP